MQAGQGQPKSLAVLPGGSTGTSRAEFVATGNLFLNTSSQELALLGKLEDRPSEIQGLPLCSQVPALQRNA